MRKLVLGAALAALLAIFVTAPAMAAGQARVSGNEVLIAKALAARGIIPKGATKAQAIAIARAYIRLKAGDRPEALPFKIAPRFLRGEYDGFGTNQHGLWNVHQGVATDKALVVLVDFGGPWRGDIGPLHGQIAAPGPADNTTFWPGDFSAQHYRDMLFGSSFPVYNADGSLKGVSEDTFSEYFLEQSHGTYSVTGDISDWVTVPFPESYYGKDSGSDSDDGNGPVWRVVVDAIKGLAAREPDFAWEDYDHENPWGIVPGGFNQPDGFIDHLILVHAGVDQSAGGGAQGDDAIWAHSWWVLDYSVAGPGDYPGFQIPGSDLWVGPYTINPEDGGIGVFSHEFGHDLGLPDMYNYIGAVDAMPQYWTLMDRGSWLGSPEFGLDTRPSDMDAWSKYYLGYVDPVVVPRGATADVTLEPAATGAADKTTVVVELPDKEFTVDLSGADGDPEWYSGMGDNLDSRLTTVAPIAVPASRPSLTFSTWFDIESGYDFGMVEVSTDGTTWTSLPGNLTSTISAGSYGITGTSRGWESAKYGLADWAGKSVYLRFRYISDGGVAQNGWEVDDIAVSGGAFADDASSTAQFAADPADGWSTVDGSMTDTAVNYYIADYRTRDGFDKSLDFGYYWSNYAAGTAEWFKYNTGLLLQYRNAQYLDNEVVVHPGGGGWLIVDSHPAPDSYRVQKTKKKASTVYWTTRVQIRDAAFGTADAADQTLLGMTVPGYDGQAAFDDSWQYYYPEQFENGVILPQLGVSFVVTKQSATSLTVAVDNVK